MILRGLVERAPLLSVSAPWMLASVPLVTPLLLPSRGPGISRQLTALLPQLQGDELERATRGIVENSLRALVLRELRRRRMLRTLRALVRCRNVEPVLERKREGEPLILAFAHIGTPVGILLGLVSQGISALVPRNGEGDLELPGLTLHELTNGPAIALFPKHAVSHLGQGGTLAIGIDGTLGGTEIRHPCLGRSMPFRKGILAIQRVSRAAVIPVHARWVDETIECVFGAPLTEREPLEVEQLAAWLEATVLADPSQIRRLRLAQYVALPHAR